MRDTHTGDERKALQEKCLGNILSSSMFFEFFIKEKAMACVIVHERKSLCLQN